MSTYDHWRTTDATPEPEDPCAECRLELELANQEIAQRDKLIDELQHQLDTLRARLVPFTAHQRQRRRVVEIKPCAEDK